jgi:enterochelin esterase-like enzyme
MEVFVRTIFVNRSTRLIVVLAIALLFVGCVRSPASDLASPVAPTQQPASPIWARVELYENSSIQRIDRQWTAQELLARSELEQSPVWADGDELTFFYQGEADAVFLCCGIQSPMQQVDDLDLWVLTVRIDNLAQAVISYSFTPYLEGHPAGKVGSLEDTVVWRGPDAPPAPERAQTLRGRVEEHQIDSVALGERRNVTVYLPPGHDLDRRLPVVYVADGELVREFAPILDPLIGDDKIPAVIVVGVHCSENQEAAEPHGVSRDPRAREYLPGIDSERFEAHERFFVYEVSEWAEQNLHAATDREQRAIFGASNGGTFAAAMGIRHPDRYANVIAFSFGETGLDTLEWSADVAPRHYLAAGTLESFGESTAQWAATLARLDVEHVHRERVSGHSFVMWAEEFPRAIAWVFSDRE